MEAAALESCIWPIQAVLVQSPEVSPNVPNQQNDQEDRVKELMKARRSTAVPWGPQEPEGNGMPCK